MWFSGSPHAPLACSAIFVAAAATDFLDGYLARSMVRPRACLEHDALPVTRALVGGA